MRATTLQDRTPTVPAASEGFESMMRVVTLGRSINAIEFDPSETEASIRVSFIGTCDGITVRLYDMEMQFGNPTYRDWFGISVVKGGAAEKFIGAFGELGESRKFFGKFFSDRAIIFRTPEYIEAMAPKATAPAVSTRSAPTDSAFHRGSAINAAVIISATLPEIRAPKELKAFLDNMGVSIQLNTLFGETSLTITFDPAKSEIFGDTEFSYQFSRGSDWDDTLDELVNHLK